MRKEKSEPGFCFLKLGEWTCAVWRIWPKFWTTGSLRSWIRWRICCRTTTRPCFLITPGSLMSRHIVFFLSLFLLPFITSWLLITKLAGREDFQSREKNIGRKENCWFGVLWRSLDLRFLDLFQSRLCHYGSWKRWMVYIVWSGYQAKIIAKTLASGHTFFLFFFFRIQPLSEALDDLYKEFNALKAHLGELTDKFTPIETYIDELKAEKAKPTVPVAPPRRGVTRVRTPVSWGFQNFLCELVLSAKPKIHRNISGYCLKKNKKTPQ